MTHYSRLLGLAFPLLALIVGCGAGGDQSSPPTASAAQYLVITIDVEALPARASQDHVERLIYGNFPGRGRAGIVEMMDIADRHGVKLTFFLDVLEEVIYPKQIEAVARLIVERGHDLQLHTHPEIMPDAFFTKLGFPRKLSNELNKAEAAALFAEVRNIVSAWEVPPFIAYRAGSYRYSSGLVQAMPAAGISFSYNYNLYGRSQRSLGLENIALFRWENDVVEIPVSYIDESAGVLVQFNDSVYVNTGNPQDAYNYILKFQEQWHASNVLIMMMHSWSLLELKSGTDYFEYKSSAEADLFDRFLASMPRQVRVVTATELAELVARGVVSVTDRMGTAEVFRQ
jgi:peptidoglycan/xylan/chitin deacetylase (PgdA/CDA1 family)